MNKPVLAALLWTVAVSISQAQTALSPVPIHRVPEIEWGLASSALVFLSGAVAIIRGRRKR